MHENTQTLKHQNTLHTVNIPKTGVTMRILLLLPLILSLTVATAFAQSKSREREREKDDPRFPIRLKNAAAVNTNFNDYAPAYYEHGMVFPSNRDSRGMRNPKNNQPYYKLYFSIFDPNGDATPESAFLLDIAFALNDGPLTFSRDWKTVYFTRNNNKKGVQKAGADGNINTQIYVAQKGRDGWELIGDMPFNNPDYSFSYPSLSADGKRLFFASNMPGGMGGMDIWMVERQPDRTWSAPVNLGPTVNTPGQEVAPFISLSGSLFFSSNGRSINYGGMDLYFVNDPFNPDVETFNLGQPFNTANDDISLILYDDGRSGYFSSNRPGGFVNDKNEVNFDIYKFEADRGIQGIGKPQSSRALIAVTDSKTGEPIQGASIHVLELTEDGFVNSKSDFYKIDLLPQQDRKNALNLQLVNKSAEDLGEPELRTNAEGKAITDFVRFKSYMLIISYDGYYSQNKTFYNEVEGLQNMNFPMDVKPLCLRAGGYVLTKEFGSRIANAQIKFVHKESGYPEVVRSNLNGEFDACLPYEGDYVVYVERDGFKSYNYRISAKAGVRALEEVRLETESGAASMEEVLPLSNGIAEGSVLVMDKIYYEYNKATLNYSAIQNIEGLLKIMRGYPDMEVDLVVHADPRGDASLNQALTDERAVNMKKYMVFRGISESKINAFGMGEREPLNRCTDGMDCPEEEFRKNSRIEVRIRKLGPRP